MPSPQSVDYPKPTDWQEFERLCRALMSEVYGAPFQRWGRAGQRQHGIDALCMTNGRTVAIQCKGRSDSLGSTLTSTDITDAVADIDTSPTVVRELIIMTTASDDVAMHQHAHAISTARVALGKCPVSVWGWQTICDHLGEHESVQRTYLGHWFPRTSTLQWLLRGAAAVMFCGLAYVGIDALIDWRQLRQERTEASIRELQQFVQLTDHLGSAYGACSAALSKEMFTFSADLTKSCIEPVSTKLNAIDKQIDKVGALLDSHAWNEIHSLSRLMNEDYRQGLIAVDMARSFEGQVISDLKGMCPDRKRDPDDGAGDKQSYRAGRVAMMQQLNYYFVLRDFIIPGVASMKARALVHARHLAGETVPEGLMQQANVLTALLQERQQYRYLEPQQPFTISVVKAMSSRSITTPTDSEDNPVERARWGQVYLTATTKSLHGRPNDIEYLIGCRLFKPEARKLATMM